ncbi:hypothetical protein LTR17_007092 [Elasticomyces elasticus]|nr:hypothetical protein LTR17_007092 [Elasticomyces elasticus]
MESRIEAIPPELQLRIVDNVNWDDALRMMRLNQHFLALIKLHQRPNEEKAIFLRKAQHFQQHNQVSLQYCGSSGGACIIWKTNRFACYSCFRILSKAEFAVRQTTKKKAKDSPRETDSASGCGRFCLDCGIKSKVYRAGTRVHSIDREILKPNRQYEVTDFYPRLLCPGCNTFINTICDIDHPALCPGCDIWVGMKATHHISFCYLRSQVREERPQSR